MAQSALGPEHRPVVFQAAPASRLWVAACLGMGGAFLAITTFMGLGEVLYAVQRLVLQAIFSTAP